MSESRENEERKETQANISDLGARQLPLHISLVAASAVDVFTRMAMSFPPTLFSFSLSLFHSLAHSSSRVCSSRLRSFVAFCLGNRALLSLIRSERQPLLCTGLEDDSMTHFNGNSSRYNSIDR